jgi:PEP-CTERM motif-containing protein
MTPAGRYADDAGLAIRLDLTNYENVAIEFDWRMYKTENLDRNKFAYYVGDGIGTPNNTYDWSGIYGSFTQVLSRPRAVAGIDGASRHESLLLPGGDVIYLVWWLDNLSAGSGHEDIGKLDNVIITGDPIVPEPASLALFTFGFASLLVGLRRRGR